MANPVSVGTDTVSAPLQQFSPWKTIDSEDLAPDTLTGLQVLIRGVFDKARLLDLIRSFVSFVAEDVWGAFIEFRALTRAFVKGWA